MFLSDCLTRGRTNKAHRNASPASQPASQPGIQKRSGISPDERVSSPRRVEVDDVDDEGDKARCRAEPQ